MASSKPRQQRLRASCDGCFLAKVKCSKARPICSRCLSCGIDCNYSPSSRAGKPKSDNSAGLQNSISSDMPNMSPGSDDRDMLYSAHHGLPGPFKIETGWHTPPTSVDGGMSRSHSGLGLPLVDSNPAGLADPMMMAAEMYPSTLPWTPPNDMSAQFAESPGMPAHMAHNHTRSQSYDYTMAGHIGGAWTEPITPDMYSYGPSQLPTPTSALPSFFPSPSATPQLRPSPRHKSSTGSTASAGSTGGHCTCFTACLQSLQALHNASSPTDSPSFDLVLSSNRKAVESCASMLDCQRCMRRSGGHTSAMLLGTVIGKIAAFYRNASRTHFDGRAMTTATSPSAVGVCIGAYVVNGEEGRWLERQILSRELRKLEEVFARFRDMCRDLSEDHQVSEAVIAYLDQQLHSTLDVINHAR